MTNAQIFRFKNFEINQSDCAMKVGTDGILLGAWCDVSMSKHVLDIGTGTGLITLMIAQRNEKVNIMAVEIDQDSCKQAEQNFQESPWSHRIQTVNDSIQEYSSNNDQSFDHIVCNPPFFSGGTLSANQDKNNVRHTIKLSHQDLLRSVRSLLSSDGKFSVILPLIEGLRFTELSETYGFFKNRMCEIRSQADGKVERLLLELSKTKSEAKNSDIVIYKSEKVYSDEFTKLTKDFYLNM